MLVLPWEGLALSHFYDDEWLTIFQGHSLEVLRSLPDESVHMAVTSPPYYGLRDYGIPPVAWGGDPECRHEWDDDTCGLCSAWLGQLGQEPSPRLYAAHLVDIFREVRRVLRHDGTLWVNLGDSYSRGSRADMPPQAGQVAPGEAKYGFEAVRVIDPEIKPKDMIGVPWMFAFAMRDDGWYLRSDVIWAKPNVMPESVDDRPTKAHEYLFLFSKSTRYFYDAKAVEEPLVSSAEEYLRAGKSVRDNHAYGAIGGAKLGAKSFSVVPTGRNKRTVWFIASQPYAGAHYAPFPQKLVEPTIQAGTSEYGVCSLCGAPWRRLISREQAYDHVTTSIGKQADGPYTAQVGGGEGGHDVRHGVYAVKTTVGWESTCEHPDAPVTAAVVLDPFAGSGTTGLVAQRLSRRALLIDLNGEYVKQQLVRNANLPLGL